MNKRFYPDILKVQVKKLDNGDFILDHYEKNNLTAFQKPIMKQMKKQLLELKNTLKLSKDISIDIEATKSDEIHFVICARDPKFIYNLLASNFLARSDIGSLSLIQLFHELLSCKLNE